ncbi:hypothetical protein [Rhodanobacter sp. FW106-PBR-R2A-1-13]|uniref:hypothetical protein n=1 Tax=Rhodanobacter sp. FW106-PBR-R2A-1-13 TaxID=3454845 RepID=UPI0034E523DD
MSTALPSSPCTGSQLARYLAANGNEVVVKGRRFTVEGPDTDGFTDIATFKTARASYHGVLCVNAKVVGRPGAEVWAVVVGRKTQASFAIHEGMLLALS